MKKVKMSKEVALSMINGTCETQKQFALENFPELGKIQDRIKTFSDVCNHLKIDESHFSLGIIDPRDENDVNYQKAKAITKCLNEGWKPDWNDSNEVKYYPWFKLSSSGGGFSCDAYVCDRTGSYVGSRLVFKSRDLAKYAATQFEEIYKELFTL